MLNDVPATWFLGLVLVVRLVEMMIARRNAEAMMAAGGRELGHDLHLATSLFHAAWLAALAFAVDENRPTDLGWGLAGLLLLGLRLVRIRALGPRHVWRLIRFPDPRPAADDPRRRLLRDPHYLPLLAEMLVIPLACGVWWLALPGAAAQLALAWLRLRAEQEPG